MKEDASNSNSQDTTTNKNSDTTTQNSNSTETQQTDNQKAQSDTAKEKTPAETPKPTAETPKPTAETPKPTAETPNQNAKTPKPHIIQYNIDGKEVRISFDDWQHFKELRRQLASGIPLDDDLITKMKPILAEAHLRDGTKIFNDKTKLSQLDEIMKHYRGKQISSLDNFLKYVLHTIR